MDPNPRKMEKFKVLGLVLDLPGNSQSQSSPILLNYGQICCTNQLVDPKWLPRFRFFFQFSWLKAIYFRSQPLRSMLPNCLNSIPGPQVLCTLNFNFIWSLLFYNQNKKISILENLVGKLESAAVISCSLTLLAFHSPYVPCSPT